MGKFMKNQVVLKMNPLLIDLKKKTSSNHGPTPGYYFFCFHAFDIKIESHCNLKYWRLVRENNLQYKIEPLHQKTKIRM